MDFDRAHEQEAGGGLGVPGPNTLHDAHCLWGVLLVLAGVAAVAYPAYRRVTARMTGTTTAVQATARAARLFDPTHRVEAAAPIHARAGERWTFRVDSLYGSGAGTETWDVLAVSPTEVQCRVTSASGGPPRLEPWSFTVPVRSERVVGCAEDVIQVGGRELACGVVQVVVPPGVDWVRVWIAMDPLTQRPTFPGVIRLEREEFRGRRVIEWELTSIARIASAP